MINKYQEELDNLDIRSDEAIKELLLRAYDAAVFGDGEAIRFLAELMGEIEDGDGDLNDNENEY
jgi:hypothetical protein